LARASLLTPIPFIRYLALPRHLQERGILIDGALGALWHDISEFEDALTLADYCDSQRIKIGPAPPLNPMVIGAGMQHDTMFIRWKQLATRHAAVTLYNFEERRGSLGALVGQCSELKDHWDRAAFRNAGQIFRAAFPDHDVVRTSVAHGDRDKTMAEREKWSLPGTSHIVRIQNDRTLSAFSNGKPVSVSLTGDGLEALRQVAEQVFRSFVPIAEYTAGLAQSATRE